MRRRTGAAVLLAAALAVGAGGAVVAAGLQGTDGTAAPATATSSATAPPPFSTPTAAAPSSQVLEPGPDEPVATDAPGTGRAGAVDVVVSYADVVRADGVVEVAGFVPGVVESDGTCTLTLTRAGESVTAVREALPDATTTTCGSLVVALDELSTGGWDAVLSYQSPSSSGSSDPVVVEVR